VSGQRVPSDAEWQRLTVAFGLFFAATVIVAVVFIAAAPFPPVVGAVLMGPPIGVTGWIWFRVVLARDADRLNDLRNFARRRRGRRRRRGGR
jgi:hypothetical protein